MAFQGDIAAMTPASPRFRFNAPSISVQRPQQFPNPMASTSSAAFGFGDQANTSGNRADNFQPYYLRPAYRFKPQVIIP